MAFVGAVSIVAGSQDAFASQVKIAEQSSSGNLTVVLSSPDPLAKGNGTSSLTLGPTGPTGSSFMTPPDPITITNRTDVSVVGVTLRLTDIHTNTALRAEMWACMYSTTLGSILFNEPLTTVEGYGQVGIAHLPIAPHGSFIYTVVYYAGPTKNTGCGSPFSSYRQTDTEGLSGAYGSGVSFRGAAPSLGPNPSATALNNPAEGGALIPRLTVSYLAGQTCRDRDDSKGTEDTSMSGSDGCKTGCADRPLTLPYAGNSDGRRPSTPPTLARRFPLTSSDDCSSQRSGIGKDNDDNPVH